MCVKFGVTQCYKYLIYDNVTFYQDVFGTKLGRGKGGGRENAKLVLGKSGIKVGQTSERSLRSVVIHFIIKTSHTSIRKGSNMCTRWSVGFCAGVVLGEIKVGCGCKKKRVLGEIWDGFGSHLQFSEKTVRLGEEFKKLGVSDCKNVYMMGGIFYISLSQFIEPNIDTTNSKGLQKKVEFLKMLV